MRITRAEANGIVTLEEGRRHMLVCCVCGLVHDFMFSIKGKEISLHIWENDEETQREFKKVLKRLRHSGLPEVADRVKEMSNAKQKNDKPKG